MVWETQTGLEEKATACERKGESSGLACWAEGCSKSCLIGSLGERSARVSAAKKHGNFFLECSLQGGERRRKASEWKGPVCV